MSYIWEGQALRPTFSIHSLSFPFRSLMTQCLVIYARYIRVYYSKLWYNVYFSPPSVVASASVHSTVDRFDGRMLVQLTVKICFQ